MFLWKNLIVVASAFALVHQLLRQGEKNKVDRRHLQHSFVALLIMLCALMLPVPYAGVMFTLMLGIIVLGSTGVPVFAGYFALTAITPMLYFMVSGVAGIQTLVTLTSPVIAGLAGLILYAAMPRAFVRGQLQPSDAALALFILLHAFLSSRGYSITVFLRTLVELSLSLGGAYTIASRGRIPSALFPLKIYAFVGGALALVSIFEAFRIWPQFQQVTEAKGIPWVWGLSTRAGLMRALGPFTDPITFSLFLSICFTGVWGLWAVGYRRKLMIIVGIIILTGTACTFSRTGGLALAGSMATFLILRRRFSHFSLLLVVIFSGLFLNSLLPEDVREGSTNYRLQLIPAALRVIEQNPIMGNNRAVELGLLEELRQGQGIVDLVNTYLGLSVEGGLLLLGSFMAIPIVGTFTYRRWRKRKKPAGDDLIFAQVTLAQLGGLLLGLVSTSLVDKNLLYVIMLSGFLTGIKLNRPKRATARKIAGIETIATDHIPHVRSEAGRVSA